MSDYIKLYEYCQTLEPKVKRNDVIRKAQEITGSELKIIKATLDLSQVRGLFISANNTDTSYVRQMGCNVIVLGRDMNECWDRFISVKELMHLFDSKYEQTASADQFSGLLSEFEMQKPASDSSSQYDSDVKTIWMALACLCPEKYRLEFIDQLAKGHIDYYGIALKLKIPERQVRNLVSPQFKTTINRILEAK